MTTPDLGALVVERTDDRGKTYYLPVVRRVRAESQYNADKRRKGEAQLQFAIEGIGDYWNYRGELNVNQAYEFTLATKENTTGGLWRDIVKVEETDQAPPVYQSPPNVPTRPDGDDRFRTKEELRWTEAMHMAVRLAAAEGGIAISPKSRVDWWTDCAAQLYEILTLPPTPLEPEPEPEQETDDLGMCPDHGVQFWPDGSHPLFGNGATAPPTEWCSIEPNQEEEA
jgi:hypothetical protein